MKSTEETKEFLENLTDSELQNIWNNYCNKNNCYGDEVYNMADFDDVMASYSPETIARKIYYGDFRIVDNYFIFDGYENLKSGYADELIYFEDLADYISRNEDPLENDNLKEFLEEE